MNFVDRIREYLADPLINLIVAATVSIVATLLINKAQERIKRLWWGVKNSTYEVDHFGKTGDFSISQSGNKKRYRQTTRDLSVCRFVFWSSGRELLLNSDISTIQPLLITFDYRCDIVGIENRILSNPTIILKIINLHQIIISFEYLESGEGAVFDIFYAGNNAQPGLQGIIKGGKVNIKKMNPPDISTKPRHQLLFGWLKPAHQIIAMRWFYTASMVFLFMFMFILFTRVPNIFDSDIILLILRVGIPMAVGAAMTIDLWQTAVVPAKLRRYYEEITKTNSA